MNAFDVTADRRPDDQRESENAQLLSDEQIVSKVRAGETETFETLLRRYNRRVYRIARSVLRDDIEAEEVAQEVWVRAFDHLDQFAGRGSFATWIARIALYEAWARARRRRKSSNAAAGDGRVETAPAPPRENPESAASEHEIYRLLESAIDALPDKYRSTFILRQVEGLSTADAAISLGVSETTVKIRLHRARALLRRELAKRAGTSLADAFPFAGSRCHRLTHSVISRIRSPNPGPGAEERNRTASWFV